MLTKMREGTEGGGKKYLGKDSIIKGKRKSKEWNNKEEATD